MNNNMKSNARKSILLTLVCIFNATALFSQNNKGIALEAGYSRITGYYSSTFNAAPVYRIRVIPYESLYFFGDSNFSFSSFQMKESDKSHFFISGLDVGINARYRYRIMTPFAGIAMGGRYLYFNGNKTNESLQTFKPSAGVRLGTFIEFSESFHAVIRSDYMINSLSGKILSETMFTAGIIYRFGGSETPLRNTEPAAIDHYTEGMKALNAKKPVIARSEFLLVDKNDPSYQNAVKLADEIGASIIAYNEGKRLINDNKKIDAIQFLEQASQHIDDAVILLAAIRNELRKDILALEKNGIAAYDSKDYTLCIAIMRRIILIDPNNKIAKVYLPRAEKRDEALRKLR
jgi:tetratricopeptide (TPR) repeat protein